VLDNLNVWEIIVLVLLGLFIFGPERLPKVIGDGIRMLRNVRAMARNATSDLSRELGTEVSLEDLHPKTFIRKHLLSEEDERAIRRPVEDAYHDVKQVAAEASDVTGPPAQRSYEARPYDTQPSSYERPASEHRFDSDAT
jgi:sec-independent protein translocase protein TatB